jgi:RNA polymerase sigma-70 factor (ECF subfamily)
MLRNDQDAHDAAHDSMVKVLKNLHRYDDQWKFSTWILGITRNTCIDEIRRRKRRPTAIEIDAVDQGLGPDEQTARQRRARRLHTAMTSLPEMYREILVLYHFEHLKYQEIADLLGVPLGTVMNRIFRARQKLRTVYQDADATLDTA